MPIRPLAIRTVAAATLSILALSACQLDPSLLGAVAAKGPQQPAQPGATGQAGQAGQPGRPMQPGAMPGQAGQPGLPGQPGVPGAPMQPGPMTGQPGMPGMPMQPGAMPQQPPRGSGGELRFAAQVAPEAAPLVELARAIDADMEDIELAANEGDAPRAYLLTQAPPPPSQPPQPPLGQPQPPQGQPPQPPQGAGMPSNAMGQPANGPTGPAGAPGLNKEGLRAAIGKGKRTEEPTADGGKKVKIDLEVDPQAIGGKKRAAQLERVLDARGKLVEQRLHVTGEDPDGRRSEGERHKKREADGSLQVTFTGKVTDPKAGEAEVKWEKHIAADGKVIGQGVLRLLEAGKELPFTIEGLVPAPGQQAGAPAPAGMPMPRPSGLPSTRPSGGPCDGDAKILALSGKAPASAILNIQVTDDTSLMAGGAVVEIRFTGTGTHLGAGAGCSFAGVYDALRTSDPSSGGTRIDGAIGGAPSFAADGLSGSIKIDPRNLTAGTGYWLRFSTQLADGSWEVAEGALLAH